MPTIITIVLIVATASIAVTALRLVAARIVARQSVTYIGADYAYRRHPEGPTWAASTRSDETALRQSYSPK